MRVAWVVGLVVLSGCASAPVVRAEPPANATCEQRCIWHARQCRNEAMSDTGDEVFLSDAILNRSRQDAFLANCAETKAECFQLCGPVPAPAVE